MNRKAATFNRTPRYVYKLSKWDQLTADAVDFVQAIDPLVWWIVFVLLASVGVVMAYPV